jgi:selenium-binding protein 1
VIEADELVAKTGYTRPHTVHCMPGGNVVVSMLGDADGNGACGFAVLDAETFEVKGRTLTRKGSPREHTARRLLVARSHAPRIEAGCR